jgi:hypothetical protein
MSTNRPLSTSQIYKTIVKDDYAKFNFLNVYPRDCIPQKVKYPSSFVINTHSSHQPGEHWLAVYYKTDATCTFFDSFGMHPSVYKLDKYLDKTSVRWTYNSKQLQSLDSSTCGYFCIYFILLKSRGLDLKTILSLFSKDNFEFNDSLIVNIL